MICALSSSSVSLADLTEWACLPRSGCVVVVAMLAISDSGPLGDFLAGIVLEIEDDNAVRLAVSELETGTEESERLFE